jgi:hypothetical protein
MNARKFSRNSGFFSTETGAQGQEKRRELGFYLLAP